MQTADRLKKIPPYLFVELRKKINKAKAEGIDVISLAIGDPVEPTPDSIIDELCLRARDPENHRYPTDEEKGMLAFRQEVARWYDVRYGVALDPASEILGLIGSKYLDHEIQNIGRGLRNVAVCGIDAFENLVIVFFDFFAQRKLLHLIHTFL